ncbi:MAG: peptidoglycan DD-metalloendopeptidase family protein [Gammaproteobacteria bacterium]
MSDFVRILLVCVVVATAASCSSALRWDPDDYVVRSGDTIYSIAFRYDLDQRDLMAWNGIDNAALIRPGQRLRLTPPEAGSGSTSPPRSPTASGDAPRSAPPRATSRPPAQSVGWQWPTAGAVIAGYGSATKTKSGIHIGGQRGQPIRAASAGRVVYAGTGLAGYGHLLIIKHNNDYLSAYGHNDKLLVGEGADVKSGQRIADMGNGPGRRPLLHFEIRRQGEPVNPLQFLPRR